MYESRKTITTKCSIENKAIKKNSQNIFIVIHTVMLEEACIRKKKNTYIYI